MTARRWARQAGKNYRENPWTPEPCAELSRELPFTNHGLRRPNFPASQERPTIAQSRFLGS